MPWSVSGSGAVRVIMQVAVAAEAPVAEWEQAMVEAGWAAMRRGRRQAIPAAVAALSELSPSLSIAA